MKQTRLEEILNRHIFSPEERAELLRKIAESPDRYVGIFRSTTPRLKLVQNLLQSREIRFGDALEEVISELLQELGYVPQPKRFVTQDEEEKSCDQYFSRPDQTTFFLVEQKVRDDHDSSKKQGQFENFRTKIRYLKDVHGSALVGIMYFIDPSLRKNRKYYQAQFEALKTELDIPLYLFYDGELFEYLGSPSTWETLTNGLKTWQRSLPVSIELDYDHEPEETWKALQPIDIGIWYKLITSDALWDGSVMHSLFPSGAILQLLYRMLQQQGASKVKIGNRWVTAQELAYILGRRLSAEYGISPEQIPRE